MFLITHGTEWPILCWCAVKQLLTHPLTLLFRRQEWHPACSNLPWCQQSQDVLSLVGVCGWQKMSSVRFSFRLRFYKINCGFCFFSVRFLHCVTGLHSSVRCAGAKPFRQRWTVTAIRNWMRSRMSNQCSSCLLVYVPYTRRNDVLPCWIGPTNCQPKWLRTRSVKIRHEEKYFWLLILSFWKRNCEWDNVQKPSPNRRSLFFENRPAETEFSVFEFWVQFGSVRYTTFSSGSAHPYSLGPGLSWINSDK